MKRSLAALICVLFSSATALPQGSGGRLDPYQADLAAAKAAAPNSPERHLAVEHLVNPMFHAQRFVLFAMNEDQVLASQLLSLWDQSRVDKQVGATATTTGSTDLVSLPSVPELFGLGVTLGALTQTVSGSVATFRGNADGMIRSIAGQPVGCNGCMGTSGLKNLNFAVSFDLSRQSSQQVATNGAANSATTTPPAAIVLPKNTKQFSSFSARYDIYNPKDTRSKAFQEAWKAWFLKHQNELQTAGDQLLTPIEKLLDPLFAESSETGENKDTTQKYMTLRSDYEPQLEKADASQIDGLLTEYLTKVVALASANVADFDQQLLAVRAAYATYSQTYDDLFKELRGKPQFSFEYTFNSPVSQPDTHNIRMIFGFNPFSGGGLLSANAAMTFYGGSIPAGAKYGRIRDYQFAAQFDRPLGNINTHPAVLTLAGYVQYQLDPSVIDIGPGNLVPGTTITLPQDAQVLLGRKGTMGIVEGKITLKMKNSGFKIPIGVSWANRTDLLNATDVRGHVGITYDLDALFSH